MSHFYFNRCLIIVLFLLLAFGCKGTQVMSEENLSQDNLPKSDLPSETPSIPELEEFIFNPDQFTRGIVPRRLDAKEVARFLIGKINKDTKLNFFIQVELVADFYDTYEVVKNFRQFLDGRESNPEEVRRSIIITRIIARLGDAEDVEFARRYYRHLIQQANSKQEFEDLILLHEALGLGGNSIELKQKIQAKIAGLEAKKDTDYQARLEYLDLQEQTLGNLIRAEKVQPIKEQIIANDNRQQRLEDEIKAYLTIEYGYIEYLQPWAARRIRKETWVVKPSEQARRVDEQPLKEDVVKAFRDFLGKLNDFPKLQTQEKESAKLRALRAVKFFDGNLSEEEETFLELHKGTQADTLANEGFMIK